MRSTVLCLGLLALGICGCSDSPAPVSERSSPATSGELPGEAGDLRVVKLNLPGMT